MRIHRDKNFISFFDEHSGFYFRSGIIESGKDTGIDPFMASFPELIDVGIMGHCVHGALGLCESAGVECYQDGLHAHAPNMSLEDFSTLAKQCRDRCFQFALGGRGDPDQHENFREILEICESSKIVPNFTTSGLGLTSERAKLCSRYCGAVAVSWYRSKHTLEAIDKLLSHNVKTNIHYVLGKNSIDEAIFRLENDAFPQNINAIVFLLHKPVGLGTRENMLNLENPKFHEFVDLVTNKEVDYKIGFDSCTLPAIINAPGSVDLDSIDSCEGARWSAYVTPDFKMLPCSFDNQEMRWAVDLHENTVEEAWMSPAFEDFRDHFRNACPKCSLRDKCLGGCPVKPEIVLCENKKKFNN